MMKKILFTTLLLIICTGYSLKAQDHLEIKAESASQSAIANPEDALIITITGDYPSYTIMLFENEPWKGAQPIQTITDVYDTTYRVQDLEPGDYHVCVMDAEENLDCQKVTVESR